MARLQFTVGSGGSTGYWDRADNWSYTTDPYDGRVPQGGDSALIASTIAFDYTVIIRHSEYSADDPLGTLGLGSSAGTTSTVQISGGSLYVGDVEDNFKIGLVDYSGGGAIELSGSGTLSADSFGHDNSVVMTGDDNALILPLIVPGNTFSTTLISGFGANDTIDLSGVAFSGGVSDVIDILDSNLSFKVGSFQYTLDFLESSRAITAADFRDDGSGGTEITLCLVAGTRISAERGDTPVELLRAGDLVRTASGRLAPVRWVGRRRIDLARHPDPEMARPIRFAPGAIAAGVPRRTLAVSPDHAMLVDGLLVAARQLINHVSIARDTISASVEYVHVELDRHDVLIADGAPAESYLDTGNRGWFGEAVRPAGVGLSIVSDEARVKPIWRRLAARVGLDIDAPAPATAAREVRLVVGGHSLTPVHVASGRFVFAVPDGADAVRLVCAAARPTDAHPWLDDRRRLGLVVVAVHCDGMELRLDGPAFGGGWWSVEGGGPIRPFRWSDGDATLRLPRGARALTICTAEGALSENQPVRLVA